MPRIPLVGRSVAVVVEQGRVLLVQSKKAPGWWVPPGGTVEARERAQDAARREVLEEAGVAVEVGRLIAYRQVWWPKEDRLELYFSARVQMADQALAVAEPLPFAEADSASSLPVKAPQAERAAIWVPVKRLEELLHFPEELALLCHLAVSAGGRVEDLGVKDLRQR